MLSVKDYPAQTAPGMLDDLLRLPYELMLTQSFAFVDRQASARPDEPGAAPDARRRRRGARACAGTGRRQGRCRRRPRRLRRAPPDRHGAGARRLPALDEAVAEVQSAFTEIGVIAVREDVNLEPAFWAQFPGNFKDIARRALISTANFAGFASLPQLPGRPGRGQPLGRGRSRCWRPPPPAPTTSTSTTATSATSPSSARRARARRWCSASCWPRRSKFKPRIVYFDKDRGAEIFLRAIGGRYDVLRPGEPTGFNPLALADTPANRAFLADWLRAADRPAGRSARRRGPRARSPKRWTPTSASRRRIAACAISRAVPRRRRPHAGDLAARLRPWCGRRRARLAVRQRRPTSSTSTPAPSAST